MSRPAGPGPAHLIAWGVVAILVGCVLPWTDTGTGAVWAWDLGILWALTGDELLMGLPPSVGAVVLVADLGLAGSVLRGTLPPTLPGLTLSGVVAAASVLVAGRMLGLHPPLGPRIGVMACLAGGLLASGGILASWRTRV